MMTSKIKKCLVLCLLMMIGVNVQAQNRPQLNREQLITSVTKVKFNNKTFYLAFDRNSDIAHVREYLPKNSSFKNKWKEMFGLYIYKNQTVDPIHFAANVIKVVETPTHNTPFHSPFEIFKYNNKRCHSVLIDFTTSILGHPTISEFNIFYFAYGSKKRNIIGYQYVHRFYMPDNYANKKDMTRWLQHTFSPWMRQIRPQLVQKMLKHQFQLYNKNGIITDMIRQVCQKTS